MSGERTTHPTPQELRNFGLGLLEPAVQEEVERHVACCDSCCQALRSVADDTLVAQLREVRTATDETLATVPNSTAPRSPAPSARLPGLPPELADHPRYRVLKLLGAGGMGIVYQAEHRLMDRAVALKVMSRHLTGSATAVERFRQEVRAAARLSHPNIVAAYDAEQAGDLQLLVMEYVEGVSLARLVENRGPLDVQQACHYARQAAVGLKHAFEQGMVHRDIKPHNLMVTRRGQIKILDFGLARLARERDAIVAATATEAAAPADGLTADGAILGTPDYIAPEQIGDARNADIRADIYGLGCTLYFLLAGHPPFPRGSAAEKVTSHLDAAPLPLIQSRPDVPPGLLRVVERMMAKNPADRYQTPAEVVTALAPWAKAQQTGTALEPLPVTDVFDGRGLSALDASLPTDPLATTWGGGPPFPPSPFLPPRPPLTWRGALRSPAGKAAVATLMALVAIGCYVGLVREPEARTVGLAPDGPAPGGVAPVEAHIDDDAALRTARTTGETGVEPALPLPLTPDEPTDASPTEAVAEKRQRVVLFVLPHRNFWYPDYGNSKLYVELGGARIVVASSDVASPAQPSPQSEGDKEPVQAEVLLVDADAADYDAVVFVGAHKGGHSEFLSGQPHHDEAVRFIRAMQAADKVVAAICGGPRVLGDAGVLRGVEATGFDITVPFLEDDGAVVVPDRPVVVSGKIVTASDWNAAEEFAAAVLKAVEAGTRQGP